MAASALLPSGAAAQRASAEIGVSLTILPPSVPQHVGIGDDGRTSLRTAPATTTWGTPVVTSRLAGYRRDSIAPRRELVPSCTEGRTGCAPREIEHRVDVVSDSPDDSVGVVRLRREYFVVAGT